MATTTDPKDPKQTEIPPPDVKPLDGTRTADGNGAIEPEILAYESLDSVAGNIATFVHGKADGKPVVFHSEKDIAAATAFQSFRTQVANLTNALEDLAPPTRSAQAIAVAIGGVTLAAKAVIELLALFRTNVDIKGVAITPDETAFLAEVAGRLVERGTKVYIPSIHPFPSDGAEVQTLLGKLQVEDQEAAARVKGDAQLKADYDALHAVVLALTAELSKASADGATLMATLLRGEGFAHAVASQEPLTLFLKIVREAGAIRLKRSLVPSKGIEYSGGVVVDYILFAHDGSVAAGATLAAYIGGVNDVSERVPG
jgi:hypothetical protein